MLEDVKGNFEHVVEKAEMISSWASIRDRHNVKAILYVTHIIFIPVLFHNLIEKPLCVANI